MSRTKKFFYNSLASAIQQIVIALTGFIIPRIMLQYYGSEINGLVSSITQFISYFNLVEAGLAGAAIYALYKPLAEENHNQINGVVSAASRFYSQAGYIFLSLVVGLSLIYPYWVVTKSLSPISVGLLVFVLGAKGVLEFFTLSKYRVLLSADQKTYVISIATIAQTVLNTFIIVVLSRFHANIILVKAVALLAVFLRSIILIVYVHINYKYINYKAKPDKRALEKRWDALYLQILGATQIGAPVVLSTIFTNLYMVSIYSIYNMILSAINGILSIFQSGLSASFGDVIARGERKKLQKAYTEFEFCYYGIITIIYSVAMITIMPFIRIYTKGITDINYDLPLIGFLFILNGWLYNIKTPQGMLVISAGMYKETRIQSTVQAAIIVVIGVILAPSYGLIGIMIASCLSNLYRGIDLMIFIPRNITKLPVQETIFRVFKMVMEMFIIYLPFRFIDIQTNSYIQWLIFAMIVGIYAVIVVVVFGLVFDRTLIKVISLRIKSILGRR
jgi:O-antigen/teichoic acid export membrane protein